MVFCNQPYKHKFFPALGHRKRMFYFNVNFLIPYLSETTKMWQTRKTVTPMI